MIEEQRTTRERFAVDVMIGRGALSTVYRATDRSDASLVALKYCRFGEEYGQTFGAMIRRELDAIRPIKYPSLLQPIEVLDEDEAFVIVLPYLAGGNLRARQDELLEIPFVVRVAHQILGALDQAHRRGYVHGAIKPENILFDENGQPFLADLGTARIMAGAAWMLGVDTAESLPYLAPEIFAGEEPSAQSDLYSMGVVLYEMLTGRLPFGGHTPEEIARQHQEAPVTPPSELRQDIPAWLEEAVLKALAKTPGDRTRTAEAMLGRLVDPAADAKKGSGGDPRHHWYGDLARSGHAGGDESGIREISEVVRDRMPRPWSEGPEGMPKSASSRATWAIGLLVLVIVLLGVNTVVGTLSDGMQKRLDAGRSVSDAEVLVIGGAFLGTSLLLMLSYIAFAIAFVFWFYKAHKLLPTLGARGLHHGSWWTVFGWFVPFWQLWKPWALMKEVWKASHPWTTDPYGWDKTPVSLMINIWWFGWLISGVFNRFVGAVTPAVQARLIKPGIGLSEMWIIGSALEITSACCLVYLIMTIDRMQQDKAVRYLETFSEEEREKMKEYEFVVMRAPGS